MLQSISSGSIQAGRSETSAQQLETATLQLLRDYNTTENFSTKPETFLPRMWEYFDKWQSPLFLKSVLHESHSPESRLALILIKGVRKIRSELTERFAVQQEAVRYLVQETLFNSSKFLIDNQDRYLNDVEHQFKDFVKRFKKKEYSVLKRQYPDLDNDKGLNPLVKANKDEWILVSGGLLEEYLIYFDFLLNNKNKIAKYYSDHIKILESKKSVEKIDSLCFIEKEHGPDGPILIREEILNNLPNIKHFTLVQDRNNRNRIKCEYPHSTNDSICIIYDLIISGNGIIQARDAIKKHFGTNVKACVVLFVYPNCIDGKKLGLEVRSILEPEDFPKGIFLSTSQKLNQVMNTEKAKQIKRATTSYPWEGIGVAPLQLLQIINDRSFSKLHDMLREREKESLDQLLVLTRNGRIDPLKSPGKDVWRYVIDYYESANDKKRISQIVESLIFYRQDDLLLTFENVVEGFAMFLGTLATAPYPKGGKYLKGRAESYFHKIKKQQLLHILY